MSRFVLVGLIATFIVGLASSHSMAEADRSQQATAMEVFNQRIMPIFRSPQPSSCVQCHLASVDLKNYILPSHEKTFLSLRDQGLIDLNRPEESKILTLIQMGAKDRDKGARLIHERLRKAEYDAFATWIDACCRDPELRSAPPLTPAERAGPARPDAVIRHTRKSRVVDSFVRHIWSQRMRCFPCHTPHELDPSNPRHQGAIKKQRELEQKIGPKLVERMHIFHETPEATLRYLIERSRSTPPGQLPLINLEDPRKSLILLKPLSKLPKKDGDGEFGPPSSVEPVSHMGGLKMHQDDQSYKAFVAWLEDYAKVVGDRYASVEDLPADNWQASERSFRLTSTPESWPTGMPVQLYFYAWNDDQADWESEPVAFTQGTVTPRRIVNGALFLLGSNNVTVSGPKDGHDPLAGGRYLVKVYVDLNHRLATEPTLLLGDAEYFGQAEFKRSRWRDGFRQAASVSGKKLIRE